MRGLKLTAPKASRSRGNHELGAASVRVRRPQPAPQSTLRQVLPALRHETSDVAAMTPDELAEQARQEAHALMDALGIPWSPATARDVAALYTRAYTAGAQATWGEAATLIWPVGQHRGVGSHCGCSAAGRDNALAVFRARAAEPTQAKEPK